MNQPEETTPGQSLENFLNDVTKSFFLPSGLSFSEMWHLLYGQGVLSDLVAAPPGAAKFRLATAIANRLWEEKGKATLYLMLTHEAIEERLGHIEKDGKRDFWNHYRGQ